MAYQKTVTGINIFLILFILCFVSAIGCAYVAEEDNVSATIRLEGLAETTGDGMLGAAPANILGVSVWVSGPNMPDLFAFYPSKPDSIELIVPAGKNRRFEVTVYISLSSSFAVLNYKAISTVSLSPLGVKEINMQLWANKTKLVIPDTNNSRIVQIDDMSGANWTVNTLISGGVDVDFDRFGRIYAANDLASTGDSIMRINRIGAASADTVVPNVDGITCLAIDRARDIIYYNTGANLYKKDGYTLGVAGTQIFNPDLGGIFGMDVDEDGILYLVCTYSNTFSVIRMNPTTGAVLNNFTIPNTYNGYEDVVVNGDFVYVSNTLGSDGLRILLLNKNLSYVGSFGNNSNTANTNPGMFYGPKKFVAVRNKKITVIDEGDIAENTSKLVSFSAELGSWETYGTYGYGTGEGIFDFFHFC